MRFTKTNNEHTTADGSANGNAHTTTGRKNMAAKKTNVRLWIVQGLLAAVFLGAGVTKLVLPMEELTREVDYPELFIRFIGVCETLGALGLILPGLTRIRPGLTSLAAAGLVIIMVGAVVLTLAIGGGAAALMPAVVGLLCAYVARGRRPQPLRLAASRSAVAQPAA
jgi:hypothetical protein